MTDELKSHLRSMARDEPERLEAAAKEWANLLKELKGTDDEG